MVVDGREGEYDADGHDFFLAPTPFDKVATLGGPQPRRGELGLPQNE